MRHLLFVVVALVSLQGRADYPTYCNADKDCKGERLAENVQPKACPSDTVSYAYNYCGGTGCVMLCTDIEAAKIGLPGLPPDTTSGNPPTTEPGCPKGTSLVYDCGGTGCGMTCE